MKGIALHRNLVRAFSLSAIIVILDQATKLWVKGFSFFGFHHAGMDLGSSIRLIDNLLYITYIENPGMAFGIEVGSQLALALLSLVASAAVVYYLHRMRDESLIVIIPMSMILGGAIGNLLDRTLYGVIFGYAPLFYGKVVDFVDVRFLHLSHFGIFNLADAAVTVGIVWLILVRRSLEPTIKPETEPESLATETHSRNELGDAGDDVSGTRPEARNFSE